MPPRFTWEVYPGLYPSQPPLRRPRFLWRSLIVPVLLAISILTLATAAGAVYYDWNGSQPAQYTVSGVAHLSTGAAWAHGAIAWTDEAGTGIYLVGPGGAFNISGVPTGGVELNLTYSSPGYAPLVLNTFVSPVYNAGSQGLVLTLYPGTVSNESVQSLSPYPNLEYFQTYVGACATIAGIAGIVGAVAAAILRRSDRPALGVVGGASGAVVPFALLVIPVGVVFPLLLILGLFSGILGAFAFALAWIELIQIGDRSVAPPAQ